MRSEIAPQICRLRNAVPSSTDSISAPTERRCRDRCRRRPDGPAASPSGCSTAPRRAHISANTTLGGQPSTRALPSGAVQRRGRMNHFRRMAEINRRQRDDDDDLGDRVPQHRLPPAEGGDGALEHRRPHRAGEIAAARDQRQRRAAPAVEPAADIDVHRRIDAAEPDQADEQSVPDPQRPGRAERRDRKPDADHQRAEQHGPARADAVGDAAHHDAADAGAEPGERAGERRNRARAADLGGDVLERHRGDPGGAERHHHGARAPRWRRPRRLWLSIEEKGDCNIQWEPGWRSLLQAAHNLTTRAARRPALSAALRQNARNARLAEISFSPARSTTKLTAGP